MSKEMTDKKQELVPKLRFPEFYDGKAWDLSNLGDICWILPGYGFPKSMQGKSTGLYPFYKVSDISNSIEAGTGWLDYSVNYIDEEDVHKLGAKPLPKFTTIFAKIGEALRHNRRAITTKPSLVDNNIVGLKKKTKSTAIILYFFYRKK